MKLSRYHFSLGDCDHGPIGLCAIIVGDSPGKALSRLKDLLLEHHTVFVESDTDEHITVYFNPDHITARDIEDTVEVEPWLPESHWDSHPQFSPHDWQAEVAANDTRQSYNEWVNSKIDSAIEEALNG